VIEAQFDHEPGFERLPGFFLPAIPMAWPGRGVCSEPGCLDQPFHPLGQTWPISGSNAGGKANVMKQSLGVIQTKQDTVSGKSLQDPSLIMQPVKPFNGIHHGVV
jgi:hypothetical protein